VTQENPAFGVARIRELTFSHRGWKIRLRGVLRGEVLSTTETPRHGTEHPPHVGFAQVRTEL
jgi:hypothetical protein